MADAFGIGAGVQGLVTRVHGRKQRLHAEHMASDERAFQEYMDSTTVQRRVADAKAAGIHPLFALGVNPGNFSGGGVVEYGDSGAAAIGEAVGQAADYWINKDSREKAETRADEMQRAQIDVLKSEARRNDAVSASTLDSIHARATQLSNQFRTPPVIYPKGQVNPPTAQIELFRSPLGELKANKQFADAEEAERRYGDIAQEVFGVANLLSDMWETHIKKMFEAPRDVPSRYRRTVR